MNFYQLLIIFSIIIFLVFSAMLLFTEKKVPEMATMATPYFSIYFAAFFVLLLVSAYYSLIGGRSPIWFALFSIYLIVSPLYGVSERKSHRSFTVFSVIVLTTFASSIPIIQNEGTIFGPDQWRDLIITSYITKKGTFEGAIGTGYYSFVPFFNLINAFVTIVTGLTPMKAFALMQGVYSLIAILSMYLIVERLSGHSAIPLIALAILLSTPRMATIQIIPAIASKSLGMFLVLYTLEKNRNLIYLVPMISFATAVIHPTGVIPVLLVIIAIIIIGRVYSFMRLSIQDESYLWLIFAITFVVTLVYWSIDTRLLIGVFSPLNRILNIFTTLEYTPSVYSPQYLGGEFLLSSYAWAFPAAISATHAAAFLLYRRGGGGTDHVIMNNFSLSSSLTSIGMLMTSFTIIILSPGASLERYVSSPAYVLMMFPAAIVFHQIMSTKQRYVVAIGLLLLSVNVFLGNSSPSWAPFENPTFGAFTSTHSGYVEAMDILPTTQPGIRVYEDNDLPLVEVAQLYDIDVVHDRSYQTVRAIIDGIKNNDIDLNTPIMRNSIIYIRMNELEDQSILDEDIDVLYSNGLHSGLMAARNQS